MEWKRGVSLDIKMNGYKMGLQLQEDHETDISSLLRTLLITLEEMIHNHQQLLATLQEEKGLIIEGNLGDLSICMIKKERLLAELKRLESSRLCQMSPLAVAVTPVRSSNPLPHVAVGMGEGSPTIEMQDDFLRNNGIDMPTMFSPRPTSVTPPAEASRPEWPAALTLRQLIQLVPSPYQERLSSCYERLRAVSAAVSEINQINGLLSSRILQQVNALLGLLTHLSAVPSIYQASGFLHHDLQNGYAQRSAGMFHLRG